MEKIPKEEAIRKIQHYCAYQERSHLEVRNRLYQIGTASADADEIITRLITEGFLNEERFSKIFAGSKFRLKKWGRNKIERALEQKGVSKNCIRSGLKEIDQQDYERVLEALITERASKAEGEDLYIKRDKISRFLIQKGYEPELVWQKLRELFPG